MNKHHWTQRHLLGYGVTLLALLAGPVAAETQIETVVVTAERRSIDEQKVPISLVAFSDKDIKDKFQNSFDVGRFVPNVVTDNFFGLTTPRTGIRGVSNADFNPQFNSSIMVYSDNVVINSLIGQVLPFFDQDRIEVLRGPQGTLFGRNSTGGAFQYFSATPTDEFEGYGQFTYGSFNKARFEGAVSGPITDDVTARLAVLVDNRDGDVYNETRNQHIGTQKRYGFRATVDYKPDELTTIRARAQYYKGNDHPAWAFMSIPQAYGGDGFQQEAQQAIGFVNPCTQAVKFDCQTSGLNPIETLEHQIYSVDVTRDLGFATLNSTTADVNVKSYVALDNNQTPNLDMAYELDHFKTNQVSEEARLTSNGEGPFKWIVGAFYLRERTAVRNDYGLSGFVLDYGAPDFDPLNPVPNDLFGLSGQTFNSPAGTSYSVTPDSHYGYAVHRGNVQNVEAYALFLHTNYAITDALTATAAVRLNDESRNMQLDFARDDIFPIYGSGPTAEGDSLEQAIATDQFYFIGDPSGVLQAARFKAVTWHFGLDYQVAEDKLLYASISRGFKAGSFDPGADSLEQVAETKPEILIDYEIGAKTEWFDRRLRVNAGFFYYDYTNFQTNQLVCGLPTFPPCSQILSNLKKAKSYGGELEITAAPIEHMLINLNFGATHARITAVTDTGGADPDGDILLHRLVGNWLPFAEDYSHNGSVSYDFVGDYGVLTPEIDWTYTGNYYTEKENDDQMQGTFRKKLGGYWIADAQVGWEDSTGKYSVTVFAKNIFDTVRPILNDEIENGSGLGSDIVYVNLRRNFGITGAIHF